MGLLRDFPLSLSHSVRQLRQLSGHYLLGSNTGVFHGNMDTSPFVGIFIWTGFLRLALPYRLYQSAAGNISPLQAAAARLASSFGASWNDTVTNRCPYYLYRL